MAYDPINTIKSTVVPITIDNIDTDQIIPARFLKATSRNSDFGSKLFSDWRYNPNGENNPDFNLNTFNRNSKILLAGDNFGCGSSREHAAWAIYDYGFRVVMAKSFADIFQSNAQNNGILLITLPEKVHYDILQKIKVNPDFKVEISLPEQLLSFEDKSKSFVFDINPFKSKCLQEGVDLLDFLVARKNQIIEFEQKNNLK